MDNCREFESRIDRAHVEDLPEPERESLLAHLEICPDCSELFDLLGRVRAEGGEPAPGEGELATMRQAVLTELARPQVARFPAAPPAPASSVSGWRLSPLLAAGIALALLAGGWILGSARGSRSASSALVRAASAPAATEAGDLSRLTGQIRTAALSNERFEDVENSAYVYSNVSVEGSEGEKLRLSFDVSRHLDLELPRTDPLVNEILVQSLVGASPVGTRIRAIGLAGSELHPIDPKVERALLVAMRSDENLGVRLLAQARLTEPGRPGDATVHAAMLAILESEPSVQMRLAAIDYLTRNHVRPEELERAIGSSRTEGDRAVYLSARSYLETNGS